MNLARVHHLVAINIKKKQRKLNVKNQNQTSRNQNRIKGSLRVAVKVAKSPRNHHHPAHQDHVPVKRVHRFIFIKKLYFN